MKAFFLILYLLISISALPGQPLTPGKDTLEIRITRPGVYVDDENSYAPFVVWWVEDENGDPVKYLFATLYNDDGNENMTDDCGRLGYFRQLTYFYEIHTCPPDSAMKYVVEVSDCYEGYEPPPDGITGCSEKNIYGQPTTVKKTWDMTDLGGNKITSGTYHIYYSSVFLDETHGTSDKVWKFTVQLKPEGFSTTIYNPDNIDVGTRNQNFSSQVIDSVEIAYGGSDDTPGNSSGKKQVFVSNVTPDPPIAGRPAKTGFCGRSSAVSAFMVIFYLRAKRRTRNRRKKK
jgi:hypothetical protein